MYMKRYFHLIFLLIFFQSIGLCQEKESIKKQVPGGRSHGVSLGIQKPLGEFSETHGIGIGLLYAHSDHRFGRFEKMPAKKFGFTYEGGIAYYTGKQEKIGLVYTYDYPHFIYIHGYGGLIYNTCKNANARLVAGPALGLYDGVTRFNIGANLAIGYFPWERFGISPGISLLKEGGSNAIATATIQLQFIF